MLGQANLASHGTDDEHTLAAVTHTVKTRLPVKPATLLARRVCDATGPAVGQPSVPSYLQPDELAAHAHPPDDSAQAPSLSLLTLSRETPNDGAVAVLESLGTPRAKSARSLLVLDKGCRQFQYRNLGPTATGMAEGVM